MVRKRLSEVLPEILEKDINGKFIKMLRESMRLRATTVIEAKD
jgi:hypothetical protein